MSDDVPDVEDGVCYDEERGVYRATFDSATTIPSMAVVTAMAAIRDTDPKQLDPLYDVVDTAALDDLFPDSVTDHTPGDLSVEFTYIDHDIRIDNCGIIEVRPPADDATRDD